MYYDMQQRYLRECILQQQRMQREAERQQAAAMRNVHRALIQQERERERFIAQSSKYPKLTNKFVMFCLARDIMQRCMAAGVTNIPSNVESFMAVLTFKRIQGVQPDMYGYRGKKVRGIKHACPAGVFFRPPIMMPVMFISPVDAAFNHDYNVSIPYFYCPKCRTVIYYFNGVDLSDETQ